ncbi:MAG TPA: D-alanyl-D-alanine carboxypeptidase family protein [Alphaproteobacteria bacterium]|nr:D-alanyl-D-alanine carboxypeptidase family protein [Alphaproteobacteria bacterium]
MKILALSIVLFAFLAPLPVYAQSVAPIETAAKQACVIDANTDTLLFQKNGDEHMPTSSMSKMMTLYLTFQALKEGKLHLNDSLTVSEHAWKQPGSRTFLNIGQKVPVEDLIRGVIVQSGNDAAVTLAEGLGGSEDNFATMMNAEAARLGMDNSHFVNATGLPDPDHYSTACDLVKLADALIKDFPQYYHYFSELTFTFNGIKQGNRNPMLYHPELGVDGLKTGHTEIGGYGLTASALRHGRRLILVVNGLDSMQAREDEPAKLLDWGYREFGLYPIVKAGQDLAEAKVWLGHARDVPLLAATSLEITLPRSARAELKTSVSFQQPVPAPIEKGQQLGTLTVSAPGMADKTVALVAGASVPRLGFFASLKAKLRYLLTKS